MKKIQRVEHGRNLTGCIPCVAQFSFESPYTYRYRSDLLSRNTRCAMYTFFFCFDTCTAAIYIYSITKKKNRINWINLYSCEEI